MKSFLFLILFSTVALQLRAQRSTLSPDFYSVQYAGSLGYANVGAGYDVFNQKGRLSFHYGYLPTGKGGSFHIAAAKLMYSPFSAKAFHEKLVIRPLDFGTFVSYHFGSRFASRWSPWRYPEGYYWWRTSLRIHLAFEQSLTYTFKESSIQSVAFYSEWNTNELYLVSYLQNTKSLDLPDIFQLGLGVRVTLR